jgi:DNA polymerase-3 subunit gamma/tau
MLALYRKYRPQTFEEVVGQDHIISVLQNESAQNKPNHAYLFTGSRGIGKTSVARIFAKSLGVSPDDVYEIDAASNRGIDDVRALREAVHTLPYNSPYKVYIVDEVHMLTKEAFNALLKTLEEPPGHVIFILATTEPHKLPDTVISRCEAFTFKRPSHKALAETILEIAKKEQVSISKSAAALVAVLADGSFRDAISTLQKIINSSADKTLDDGEVETILGAPKHELVLGVVENIANLDADGALEAIHSASEANADMQVFLKMLLRSIRYILLLRFSKSMAPTVESETGEEEFKRLTELSKTARNINSKVLVNFLEASSRQAYASIPELPIELAIIKSCEAA